MNKDDFLPVILERESEKLRQEKETFDQRKEQENRWFKLRLIMGYSAVVLLAAIMVVSSFIVLNYKEFPAFVVTAAGGALFGDVLGLLICVWKIVLNPNFMTKLEPATITVNSYEDLLGKTNNQEYYPKDIKGLQDVKGKEIQPSTQPLKDPLVLYPTSQVQRLPSGISLHYYSSDRKGQVLDSFKLDNNLARLGLAKASSCFDQRLPHKVFEGQRNRDSWTLDGGSGWFEASWDIPVIGRYILLINRPSSERADPWGQAEIWLNKEFITKLECDFSGKMLLIFDLGSTNKINKVRFVIEGKTYPGLSSLEIHPEM